MKKTIIQIMATVLLLSCGQNPKEVEKTEKMTQDSIQAVIDKKAQLKFDQMKIQEDSLKKITSENSANKFMGYWLANGNSGEVLRIFQNNGYNEWWISDGNTEVNISYNKQENKFVNHSSGWDDIFTCPNDTELICTRIVFGGKSSVFRTYHLTHSNAEIEEGRQKAIAVKKQKLSDIFK